MRFSLKLLIFCWDTLYKWLTFRLPIKSFDDALIRGLFGLEVFSKVKCVLIAKVTVIVYKFDSDFVNSFKKFLISMKITRCCCCLWTAENATGIKVLGIVRWHATMNNKYWFVSILNISTFLKSKEIISVKIKLTFMIIC